MLTARADDLRVELVEHEAHDTTGSAHWLANYTFTQTGRKVHNDVRARFRFADMLIAEHDDAFGFHTFARQALGPPGGCWDGRRSSGARCAAAHGRAWTSSWPVAERRSSHLSPNRARREELVKRP
jgi:hypothetical protein